MYAAPAFAAKFFSFEWSSGARKPESTNCRNWTPLVITIRSKPIGCLAASCGWTLANQGPISSMTSWYFTVILVSAVNFFSSGCFGSM